jgi:cell division protein FtsB
MPLILKHLPGVAAAAEVHADGLDLAGYQLSVLEKVEELTLYTLQQHEALKQLEGLRAENASLRKQVKLLQSEQLQVKTLVAQLLESQQVQLTLTSTTFN